MCLIKSYSLVLLSFLFTLLRCSDHLSALFNRLFRLLLGVHELKTVPSVRPPDYVVFMPVFLHSFIGEAELLEVALQVRKLLLQHLADEMSLKGLAQKTKNGYHVTDHVLSVVLCLNVPKAHTSRI
jgi:hypothetical protein